MQKDPTDRDSEFESFVFCIFLHDYSQDSKELVCTRLWEKMLSARIPVAIYRALICLKKPLRKAKKSALMMSFRHILLHGQVMIRHPRGENSISWLFHSRMMIRSVPVTHVKDKIRKISPFCKTPKQSLTKENLF